MTMIHISRIISLFTTAVVLSLFFYLTPVLGAEFRADMIDREGKKAKIGKLMVKDYRYRIDLVIGDEDFSIYVDKWEGVTRLVRTKLKQYVEAKNGDPITLINDPFQGFKYTLDNFESQLDGNDTINEYFCDRYKIVNQDQTAMTYWYSKKLDFPLKVVVEIANDKRLEVKHIREGALPDSLFTIPEDYTRMIEPGKEPVVVPDWVDEIASTPVLTPPFERNLSSGGMARIKVVEGKSIWLKGVGIGETNPVARAIPFKNGKPIKWETYYNNFARSGVICTRRHESTEEADEIVVRVYESEIQMIAKYGEMNEKTVLAGEEIRLALSTRDNIEVRIVNTVPGKTICSWDYYENGQPLSDEIVGSAELRTKTLLSQGDVHKAALSAHGDELVITVGQGGALVKLGQFDTYKF